MALALVRGLRLMTVRRPPSIHGVCPSGSCSSRPAVPLSGPRLSCPFSDPRERGSAVTSEVFPCPWSATPLAEASRWKPLPGRGTTDRKCPRSQASSALADEPATRNAIAEPYPRGCSPLQGFLLHRLELCPASSACADEPETQHHPLSWMSQKHSIIHFRG